MQTATLDAKVVQIELIGMHVGRLLGERVVVDKEGIIKFSYIRLGQNAKVTKRKQLSTDLGEKFYMYELAFKFTNKAAK